MKFSKPLDAGTREHLHRLQHESDNARVRQRAHAVLLSDKHYSIDQIADIFFVDRDTASRWLSDWNARGFDGLHDAPRSGRPPKLSKPEQDQALRIILENPRQIKLGQACLEEHFHRQLSLDWLRDLLHRSGYHYKRMRTSVRAKRDEAAFRRAQLELKQLHEEEARGEIDLYYFDESGFALRPAVPYAWHVIGERLEIEQTGRQAINVLGLMRRDLNRTEGFVPFVTDDSVTSETVIACLDCFAAGLSRQTVVVLDNAPTHKSKLFEAARSRWKQCGLDLYFLPS